MRDPIEVWIENNNLEVRWINERVFHLNGQDYLCIRPKNGKLFDEDFNLIIGEEESGEILIENYCFEFGGQVYYTPLKAERVELNILKYIGKSQNGTGFPFLGIHSSYEICGGSMDYQAWCAKASFLGITALGISEKHTLAGALKFQQAASKSKIKSIIGETITVKTEEDDYRVKLYVKNEEGWVNLLKIHKSLNVDNLSTGIPCDIITNHSAGLYCVICHDTKLTFDIVNSFALSFENRLYYQFDPVQYKAQARDLHCMECLKNYLDVYRDTVPPILITDAYYLDKEDNKVKKILNFIGQGRFEYQSDNQYFKSLEEVSDQAVDLFKSKNDNDDFAWQLLADSLESLEQLAADCDFKIKTGEIHLPKYELSEEEKKSFNDIDELFWYLIEKGLSEKVDKEKIDIYLARIEREYDIISRGNFQSYFLILSDINNWCERNKILVGSGRGSSSGSIISYLLGITKVDAIQYDLIFERFLNESRIGKGLPDIDCDYPTSKRGIVKKYMEDRFGYTNVCSIGSYNTLQSKAALRDLLRLHGEQPQLINYYTAMIEKSSDDFADLFVDGSKNVKLKNYINQHIDAVNEIPLILGQPKSESIHASGVILTPPEDSKGKKMEIWDWFPCKIIDGALISEWEGVQLDDAGFLKADILGLGQLDKLQGMIDLIKVNRGKEIILDQLDTKDKKVFELFALGMNQDVFQFGTDGLSSYCKEVKPESIEELAVINALYRPGPMDSGAHTSYVKIKFSKKEPEYDWGTEEILKSTFGLYTFQEQIIKMVQSIAGFSLTDGDGIRKSTGKKDLEKMKSYKEKFIAGAVKNGCPEVEAHKIWGKIEVFAGYSFNLSHAIAYSLLGYQTQWIKRYYPLEFWTISLQHAKDDEIPKRISEMRKFEDLNVKGPNINTSGAKFYTDWETNSVYWSLSRINQVGDVSLNAIIKEREERGKFFSLDEFITRVRENGGVNSRVVKHLILSGCFDEMHGIKYPMERLKLIKEYCNKYSIDVPEELIATESYTDFYWYKLQRSLSGYGYFDYSTIDATNKNWAGHDYVGPDEVQSSEYDAANVVVYGIVVEAIKRNTKKGEMCKLTLDHNNDLIDVVIWPTEWNRMYDKIEGKEGFGIGINGKVLWDAYNKKNCVYTNDSSEIEIF